MKNHLDYDSLPPLPVRNDVHKIIPVKLNSESKLASFRRYFFSPDVLPY